MNTDQNAPACTDLVEPTLEEIKNYGGGQWFWPKNHEFYSPDFPLAGLNPSQDTVLDHLNFLAYRYKSWRLVLAASFVYRACRGKVSERTIWATLKQFAKWGIVRSGRVAVKKSNVYLISPICMRGTEAMKFAHYEDALKLQLTVPPPIEEMTVWQKRHMSKQAQIAWLKQENPAGEPLQ